MEPIYLSIQQKETGSRIKSLLRESGYTVRDIQNAMGFENPPAPLTLYVQTDKILISMFLWVSYFCISKRKGEIK